MWRASNVFLFVGEIDFIHSACNYFSLHIFFQMIWFSDEDIFLVGFVKDINSLLWPSLKIVPKYDIHVVNNHSVIQFTRVRLPYQGLSQS